MHKNEVTEGSKLPQMQCGITCSNNSASKFINLSECFPIEPELIIFKDCFDVFGDACPICSRRFHDAS